MKKLSILKHKIFKKFGLLLGIKIPKLTKLEAFAGLQPKAIKQNLLTGEFYKQASSLDLVATTLLKEKQKVKLTYSLSHQQLQYYFKLVRRKNSLNIQHLFRVLESRFDCILYRLGFVKTILMARQLISHGHFLINNTPITFANYHLKINDVITIKSTSVLFLKQYSDLNTQTTLEFFSEKVNKVKYFQTALLMRNIPTHLQMLTHSSAKKVKEITLTNVLVKIDPLKLLLM